MEKDIENANQNNRVGPFEVNIIDEEFFRHLRRERQLIVEELSEIEEEPQIENQLDYLQIEISTEIKRIVAECLQELGQEVRIEIDCPFNEDYFL